MDIFSFIIVNRSISLICHSFMFFNILYVFGGSIVYIIHKFSKLIKFYSTQSLLIVVLNILNLKI